MINNLKKIFKKSPFEFINIFLSYIHTKIFYKNAKLIRLPIFRTNIGNMQYGKDLSIGPGAIIDLVQPNALLKIGDRFSAYHRLHIGVANSVTIGDDVLIASNVYISDHSHGFYKHDSHSHPDVAPNLRELHSSPITIGDKTWLGETVHILPGVNIGKCCIIGAGSVVTKSIPDYCIAAGNPAKIIKKFNFDSLSWV